MRTIALALLLSTASPSLALAAPASPGPLKRFIGRYSDKVHAPEVREALRLATSMSERGGSDQLLLSSTRKLAPKLPIFSLLRLMKAMKTPEAQNAAASHYILSHAATLSPNEVVEIAAGLETIYPETLEDFARSITALDRAADAKASAHYYLGSTPGEDVREAWVQVAESRGVLTQKKRAVEDAVAQRHDALILSYLGHRQGAVTELGADGLTPAQLLVLSKAAKLDSTKKQLEQFAINRVQ